MLKSLSKFKRLNKEKFKISRCVQDTIPIEKVYKDGIFSVGKRYSKTYMFSDINYSDASGEDKKGILLGYGEILNSLDAACTAKITILNRKVDPEEISNKILIHKTDDELDDLRQAYNDLILENLAKSDNLIQEKYITITTFKNNISEARTFFSRISLELSSYFGKIGSDCKELTTNERLKILHDFYSDPYEPFEFDINGSTYKGHSFKEKNCPDMSKYEKNYFKFNDRYGRVLYLENYPQYLKDKFVAEICGLNKNLVYSMDILTIPTDESVNEAENKLLGVNTNITNWQQRQNANNSFSAVIPYDMESQRKECKEFLDDLTLRDQKMLLCNITLVNMADSKEELDMDTETIQSITRTNSCELSTLFFASRQLDGLVIALPIGINRLDIFRTLLTESASAFVPFRAREVMDPGGTWYGQNKLTNNLIICDKAELQNLNAFLLGVPGAGKSFLAKEEIDFYACATNNDILVCDLENEYSNIIKKVRWSSY